MNLDDLLKKSSTQGTSTPATPSGVKKTESKPVVQSEQPTNQLEALLGKSQQGVVLYPQKPTFAEYNKAATEAGKKDVSTWSKFTSLFKTGVKSTLDYLGEKRKENNEESFKMRQMLYPRKDDPMRFVTDENGNRTMTNNALEAFEAAQTEEEKAAILAADTAEIPLIKMLNSPTGKKVTKAISDKTSNVPLKAVAKFQAAGDEIYEAFTDPSFQNAWDVAQSLSTTPTESNKEKYKSRLDPLIAESVDETNPRWQKILYGVQNSGVQSAIGALLSVGTSYLTRNPTAGKAVGTAYFGSISAESERSKYEDGNIDNPSAIGNIAIDTIGDQMLSGLAEAALKNFAKEGAEATLKEILKEAGKGFVVEGGTETSQSLLKYANDYTAARTEDEKQAIADSFAEYIKSGAMVDEFLIGGISGASINVIATGAGTLVRPVVDSKGVEVSPEAVESMKEQIRDDVDAALDTGDLGDITNLIPDRLDISEESAVTLVQEVAQDIVAENADREAPEGSPEDAALQTDITNLLNAGVNPADISIALSEQTAVSDEYAQSAVARALAKLNSKVEEVADNVETIVDNTEQIKPDAQAYVVGKLTEQGLDKEVIDTISTPLTVAISGRGTPAQKKEAIALLADPANESSRAIYEEEMGITLPDTREESEAVLQRNINKSKTRYAAEQMTLFELDRSEAGYRGISGTFDATKENNGVTAFAVRSTFPDWIPSELRSSKDFQKVQKAVLEGKRPKETDKIYKQAKLYDLIQERIAKYEAELEENAYNMAKPTPEGINLDDIPFQVANAQIQSESLISMAEAEAIVRQYFSADEVSVEFLKNLRTPRGIEAWGKYSKGVISFIENPRIDTPQHESVHAFLDLFVAESDRKKFLDTAYAEQVERLGEDKVKAEITNLNKRYNDNLSEERVKAIYAEEALADGFTEYVQGRNQKTALQQFFDRVIAFIKSIGGIADAQRLYEDIIARKRSRKAQYERAMRDFKPDVDTFSQKEARALTTRLLKKLEGRQVVSKQFISDLTNSPDLKQVEKDLIRGVLETEGDKVNVAEFTDKVVAELLPLTRVYPQSTDENGENQKARYEGVTLPSQLRGGVKDYREVVYRSPIETSAGEVHFGREKNYFGHTRIEDMYDNATRRVIEVQSDLYQKGRLQKQAQGYNNYGFTREEAIKKYKENFGVKNRDLMPQELKQVDAFIADNLETKAQNDSLAILEQYNDPTAHFRMIREEVRKAAQDGMKVVQFPTGQTAMRIEGLGQNENDWAIQNPDESANSNWLPLKPDMLEVGMEVSDRNYDTWVITDVLGDGKFKAVSRDTGDYQMRGDQVMKAGYDENGDEFDDTVEESEKETFDISGKVDTNNPIYRFYEKEVGRYLKSKYDMKVVTDKQGVTWYEVKVDPQAAFDAVEAFSIKNRIHEEDRAVAEAFIDHARIKSPLSDAAYKMAEALAEKWNISMDLGLARVANEFEKALANQKKVTGTILYSEKKKNLVNVHNLSEGNLLFSNDFGGIINPSIAIVNTDKGGFDNFGEISLIGNSDFASKGNTYRADAYTPRFPRFVYPASSNQTFKIKEDLKEIADSIDDNPPYIEDNDVKESLERNPAFIKKFLDETGTVIPMREAKPDEFEARVILESFRAASSPMLDYEFSAYMDGYLRSIGVKPQIFGGYTYSGRRRYLDATKDNVLKVMNKKDRAGESFNYGLGSLRAKITPKLSPSKIAKNRDKIVTSEEFEVIKKEMDDRFLALGQEFADLKGDNSFGGYNDVLSGLTDYIGENWRGFLETVPNVPQALLDKVAQFKADLIEMPTEYFETKIKGEVDISEFDYAVVPAKTSQKALDILNKKGLKVITYDGSKEDRTAKIDSLREATNDVFYSAKEPASFVRSKTYSVQAFKNLSEKVPEFKKARAASTETHAYTLGKETKKIESAKLQKIEGKVDGMNTESYAVLVDDQVVFISEKIEDSAKWLADNAGKSVSIEQNATSTVFMDGNEAYVIVTSKDLIPLEIGNIQGTTDVQTIKFYDTKGQIIETHAVTGDGTFYPINLAAEATRNNATRITFPSYFAAIAGRPVLVKNDGVARETGVDETKVTRVDRDQTSQMPVEPNQNDPKVKKSRAYQKARERLAEQFQEDVTYTAVRIDDQMAKAFELVDNNFEYAKAVALGLEQPPLDITDTAISIAVSERAKDTKDYQLQADAEKARSLRQSRRGQELVLERGRVDENSPEYFIRNLIDRRKFLAQVKYKPILSRLKPFTEILEARVTEAKKKGVKKLKTDLEIKGEQLDDFLKEMAC